TRSKRDWSSDVCSSDLDGSSVESIIIGESMDMGDKATNKAMAAAYKYACFQVFCIPTEEMQDPDAETPVMKDPPAVQEENKKPSDRKRVVEGEGEEVGS